MLQRIELGANGRGELEAITHDAITVTSQYEDFFRQETGWSGLLYACANAKYEHKLARLDLATSCDMRCPSAATGVYALECAIDELAVALKPKPIGGRAPGWPRCRRPRVDPRRTASYSLLQRIGRRG